MIPEALNNLMHVCLGVIICTVPGLIIAFIMYCILVAGARADRCKEKLLEKKYGKGNDESHH